MLTLDHVTILWFCFSIALTQRSASLMGHYLPNAALESQFVARGRVHWDIYPHVVCLGPRKFIPSFNSLVFPKGAAN